MSEEKLKGDFYTGVRTRGMLNYMLKDAADRYKANHPDEETRWEFAPLSGDMQLVTFREAQGYHIVKAEELGLKTESSQKDGPIRRGDLILMAAPREVHQMILDQDAEAADQDYRTPERVYKENLESKEYKSRGSDDTLRSKAIGNIKRTVEEIDPADFVELPRQNA